MKRIKRVTRFCIGHSIILVPLLVIGLLDSVVAIFDTYISDKMDTFIAFGNSLSNSDKVSTLLNTINAFLFETYSHSYLSMTYTVISDFFKCVIVFGMVHMAFENGFSVLEDCWYAIKKYTLKILKSNAMVVLLVFILICAALAPLIYPLYSFTDDDWAAYIFPVIIYLLLCCLVFYLLFIWLNYANVAFVTEDNTRKALACFLKKTAKCWLAVLPAIISLDIATLLLKYLFSNLEFFSLLSSINDSLINALSTFIKTVWIIMVFYDKNRVYREKVL